MEGIQGIPPSAGLPFPRLTCIGCVEDESTVSNRPAFSVSGEREVTDAVPCVHLNVSPGLATVVTRCDCAFLSDGNRTICIRKYDTLQGVCCRATSHVPCYSTVCRMQEGAVPTYCPCLFRTVAELNCPSGRSWSGYLC